MGSQVEEITCDIDGADEKIIIETELKRLDIHFNWNLNQSSNDHREPDTIVPQLKRKLEEMLNNSEFTFQVFCCQLVLAQELMKYDTACGLQKIIECEEWVRNLGSDNCREPEYVPFKKALEYIALGCKAFALFKSGSITEAEQILKIIPIIEEMEERQKSGICAVRACAHLEYGLAGFLRALEYINTARSLCPEMAEWHYLTGKTMSRIRHIKSPSLRAPGEEEIIFYRTAYELSKQNDTYALHVAQIIREKACALVYYRSKGDHETIKHVDEMNAEASSLYRKVILANHTDSYTLARSAFGMVKLPGRHGNIAFAVKAIEKALEISPYNPLANHYAGLIFSRYCKDHVKGLKYLEIASKLRNYFALLDWMILKYIIDPDNYVPIPDLIKALEFEDYSSSTLTEIAAWYIFKEHNVFKAWEHLKEARDTNVASNYKSGFVRMRGSYNFYEVISDEVKLRIALKDYKDKKELETLQSIRDDIVKLFPSFHPTDFNNLLEKSLNESLSSMRNYRKELGFSERDQGNRLENRNRGNSSGAPCRTNRRY